MSTDIHDAIEDAKKLIKKMPNSLDNKLKVCFNFNGVKMKVDAFTSTECAVEEYQKKLQRKI